MIIDGSLYRKLFLSMQETRIVASELSDAKY